MVVVFPVWRAMPGRPETDLPASSQVPLAGAGRRNRVGRRQRRQSDLRGGIHSVTGVSAGQDRHH
jgi:hypothetical protein